MRNRIFPLIGAIILTFLIQSTLKSQWITQTTPFTSHYYTLFFIDENTGWAAGDGFKVIKTTNGGTNWIHIATPDNGRAESMYFASKDTGFIGTYSGKLFRTYDGGYNWNIYQLSTASSSRILRIKFVNDRTGWAVGENLIAHKTINRGNSFFKPSSQLDGFSKNDVEFFNDTIGFVVGGGLIRKTTNRGYNWSLISVPNFPSQYYSWNCIEFINEQTGWVGGTRGFVAKTTNSGNNWSIVSMDSAYFFGWYNDMHFINDTLGYAGVVYAYGGGGAVHRTTNGGVNWTSVIGGTGFVDELSFPSNRIGYGGGGDGKIYKTSNATLTEIENVTTVIPERYMLYQNYPNPFNPVTRIKFDLAAPVHFLELIIYNSLGMEMMRFTEGRLTNGVYEYEVNGSKLSSGIYYYMLRTDGFTATKKMVLLK